MCVPKDATVRVRVRVWVSVDPTDQELLDRIRESGGTLSIADVVRDEIESNLASVSYVREVSIG
jgi:hypothetical protein